MRNVFKDWLVRANVHGSGNEIVFEEAGRRRHIMFKTPQTFLKIRGNGNIVTIRSSVARSKTATGLPAGLSLTVRGNGNRVVLDGVRFVKSAITLVGDGCSFEIGPTADPIREASFWVADGGSVQIGKDFGPQERLKVVVDNDAEKKHRLVIGDGVLTAVDTVIRTSDGHSLVDPDTGLPVNEPDDIVIGNRVWIGTRSIILKGAVLADGCVVGANSLVNKKFTETGLLLVGSPARVLRRGVQWDERPYGTLLAQKRGDHAVNERSAQ